MRFQFLYRIIGSYRPLTKCYTLKQSLLDYHIAQKFGGVKLWRIDRFRVLVGENVGEFTIANIATLMNLEFGRVKYWRMVFGSPN